MADPAIGEHAVLAERAFVRGAERDQRAPRALVARVGLELDAAQAHRLERVTEQQQLALDVDAGTHAARAYQVQPISATSWSS